jgi:uncharacterized protein
VENFGFWILDFGFGTKNQEPRKSGLRRRSKIQNRKSRIFRWFLAESVLILVRPAMANLPAPQSGTTAKTYQQEIAASRQRRVAALQSDDGWLTVAGLFWLKNGKNTVGTGAGNDIVLPADSAPGRAGVFEFENGVVTFEAAADVNLAIDGKPATGATMTPDTSDSPTLLTINHLTMFVIKRGDRFGIRLRDKSSEMRRHFTGIHYFAVEEAYRVHAKWVPYDPPKSIAIPNILGQTEMESCPGRAEFTLEGHPLSLEPVVEGRRLFFIFRDLTSGHETYPPGRFLYAEMPMDGEVLLDFNKAQNPPCAFTPFATCPLPPEQNRLDVRVEAGELRYGH